jgi:hypothetical protein
MKIFKLQPSDEGKSFIIRFLPYIKDMKSSIVKYKTHFNEIRKEWGYRYMCYALVNDNLEIFDFGSNIYSYLIKDMEMILPKSSKALKVTVGVRKGYLDNEYSLVEDEKFRYDNTEENKSYLVNLLQGAQMDLLEELDNQIKLYDVKGSTAII